MSQPSRRTRTRPRRPAPVRAILAAGAALALAACGEPDADAANAGPEDTGSSAPAAEAAAMEEARMPDADGWITLFDGTDLSAWRGYGRRDVPAAWQARSTICPTAISFGTSPAPTRIARYMVSSITPPSGQTSACDTG